MVRTTSDQYSSVLTDHEQVGTPPSKPAANSPVVSVRELVKTFRRADGATVAAVDGVSLDVHQGEFVVLLGPSGCGKTTLLRCIAGLERPEAGEIDIHGKPMYSDRRTLNTPPERRQLSMIFQSYALWPHMTAFENVAYPLRARKVPKATIAERVHRVLEKVGIAELARQHPGNMSGGQQQRLALARALVAGDNVVLFDEPLSNVDAKVREQLRLELLSMQREIGFSGLYVTHDQVEAMELAHQIAVMRAGKIAQYGPPREIYERPSSRYVANFIGSANELAGTVTAVGDAVRVATEVGAVEAVAGADGIGLGDEVVVVFRPERCTVSTSEVSGPNAWLGSVTASLFVGSHTEHVVAIGDDVRFRIWRPDGQLFDEQQEVWVTVPPSSLRVVPADEAGEVLAVVDANGSGSVG